MQAADGEELPLAAGDDTVADDGDASGGYENSGDGGNGDPPEKQPVAPPAAAATAGAEQNPDLGEEDLGAAPERKRRKVSPSPWAVAEYEESRRGFQKLWTDADEIAILEGFLEFTSSRGTTQADYQHDTGPFYDQIRGRLQLDFNKNQLVEKLRRLKKKYRNMAARMANTAGGKEFVFKSAHDRATYEIACKIWSPSFKRNRNKNPAAAPPQPQPQPQRFHLDAVASSDPERSHLDAKDGALNSEQGNSRSGMAAASPAWEMAVVALANPTPLAAKQTPSPSPAAPKTSTPNSDVNVVEKAVRSCLSPLFGELLNYATGDGGGLPNPRFLCGAGAPAASVADDKWRKQQILELEVYLKRVELLHEEVKLKLEELRSAKSS